MSLSQIIVIGSLIGFVGFNWHQYSNLHLPEFQAFKMKVLYKECMDECKEVAYRTCELNGTPPTEEHCKYECPHCTKFIIKE
jgi:hypothetical protein